MSYKYHPSKGLVAGMILWFLWLIVPGRSIADVCETNNPLTVPVIGTREIVSRLKSSTFLGGTEQEGYGQDTYFFGFAIAIAGDGSVYVAGSTSSGDFPVTPYAFDTSYNGGGSDIFVTKFSDDLSTIRASTILGGNGRDEFPDIMLDDNNNVYISGITYSANIPTTPGAYDRLFNSSGNGDAFVAVFDSDLSILLACTYLGGMGMEWRPRMAIDKDGFIFVAGETYDGTFPTVPGSYDIVYNGGDSDFFISKLNNVLTELVASTFIGGIYHETWPSIIADSTGCIYISGSTGSYNYPSTTGVFDPDFNGPVEYNEWNMDGCISKLDHDLSNLMSSTFIGANDYEGCLFLTLSEEERIIVGGHTLDPNYPITPNVIDGNFSGDEYFISILDASLMTLMASTYLTPENSGMSHIWGKPVCIRDKIYITGSTDASDLFVTDNAYDATFNGAISDGFLRIIRDDLSEMIYSSYLGGSENDGIDGVMLDDHDNLYVVGYTTGQTFPMADSAIAYDSTYNGGNSDAIMAIFTAFFTCGDMNTDKNVNLLDILFMIDHIYGVPPGPAPVPPEAADVNSDDNINLLDILYLIGFLYSNPPGPEPSCS